MANQYIQAGNFIDYTPGSAVAAGDPVILTDRVLVAPRAIAANTTGSLATSGVFKLQKTTSQAWTLGQKLYWDGATSKATSVAGSLKVLGYAAAAAGSADTEGLVLLGT